MKIYWTKKSKSRFQEIKKYIEKEFGFSVSERFQNRVLSLLDLLEKYPGIGSLEVPEKEIHGFQISKQTRVFYRIKGNRIFLLTFFDSRQNPEKKPK